MQKKSLGHTQCPVARSLDRVGEWWSILILRDAFYGMTRFDEFQKSLGIAPSMLTRRLNHLVEQGLFERRCYQERPQRFSYHLTPMGRDFRPVLLALLAWGNRHFAAEGEAVRLVDATTGDTVEPALVDARTGKPIQVGEQVMVAGPGASAEVRRRMDALARRRAEGLGEF